MSTATTQVRRPADDAGNETDARGLGENVQHLLRRHPTISPAIILALTFAVFTLLADRFATPATASLLLQQSAVVAMLAAGQTLIILTGGIDLSNGAICTLAVMVVGKLAGVDEVPALIAIAAGLLVGLMAGLINGSLVTRLELPPFIATLGTLSVFTAVALLYSNGKSVVGGNLPSLVNWMGTPIALGSFTITTGVIVALAVYLVVGYMLSHTAWGQHVYATGDNSEAARLTGIRVSRVVLSVYVLAGLIYALTAWVLIGRAGVASPNLLADANLASITAVVIGGTSLFGGRGGPAGTLLGVLIVQSFAIALSLLGVDEQYRLLAIGCLVLLAVSIDQWIRKVSG